MLVALDGLDQHSDLVYRVEAIMEADRHSVRRSISCWPGTHRSAILPVSLSDESGGRLQVDDVDLPALSGGATTDSVGLGDDGEVRLCG